MDLCEHAFYKPEEKYTPRLYCKIEDKMCMYSKRCLKVDRYIPLEGEMWKECYIYIMEKRKNIPKGSYLVQTIRPHKSGKLYLYVLVEDDKIEKILSNFDKLEQDYVYLRKNATGGYQVSLEPIVITQSDNINNKEDIVEEIEKEKPKKRNYNKKKEPKKEVVEDNE